MQDPSIAVERSVRRAGPVRPAALRALPAFLPFAALLLLVFGAPLWTLLRYAFADDLSHWGAFFDDPASIETLLRTMEISLQTTLICVVLGYLLVGAILRASPGWRKVLLVATVLPFLTSVLVKSYGWIVILGNNGPVTSLYNDVVGGDATTPFIYNRIGVLVGMVHYMLPFFVLPLYAVMSQIPDNLRRAARTLGANEVESFLVVDLRLSLPGAAAGGLLVFVTSLGFFVTPALMGGPNDLMLAQLIDQKLTQSIQLNSAAVLAVVLAVGVLACLIAFRLVYPIELLFVQSPGHAKGRRSRLRRRFGRLGDRIRLAERLRRLRQFASELLTHLPWGGLVTVAGGLLALFFVAPLLIVVPISFTGESFINFPPDSLSLRWYEAVLSDSSWRAALWNSLLTGAVATLIVGAVGLPLAFSLVRSRIPPAMAGLTVFAAALPVVLPLAVLSLAIFVWYLELRVVGDMLPLAASHALLGLPFLLVIVMAALRDFDRRLERAARSLGASRVQALARITFPTIRRSLAAGLLFAFLLSYDEILIARSVTNIDTTTLPVRLWDSAIEELSPALAVVSVLSICLATVTIGALAGAQRYIPRNRRRA